MVEFVDYRTTGVHQINKWLWSKLATFEYKPNEMAFDAYGVTKINIIPIVPTQQQPEVTNLAGGPPFIVYTYITTPNPDLWSFNEQGVYIIYDSQPDRLRAIHGYMVDLLRRLDVAARDVNNFLAMDSPFEFKYIGVNQAIGPDEFSQEGGRQGAMIATRYEFTRNTGISI